ncbi:hypothetical protein POM88_029919 [Heracleum sosnowskyi]|uniref:Reverse transcriptase n=1 Tax=Heracleum sosnowskyi TaxID=360622 RepID=A0AAD8MHL7_9APIA|nr:hypothetical protein POM88_029919 [Heracleum sosnowskyi]
MENGSFTWFGAKQKKSRLDRVLANTSWMDLSKWRLRLLNRMHSDHSGLFLSQFAINWGPILFQTFNCWLKESSLNNLLVFFWKENVIRASHVHIILKDLKVVIKNWSQNFNRYSDEKIKLLEDIISAEEQKMSSNASILNLRKDLEHLYEIRSAMLRQKARLKWDLQGDRNNKFFHQSIKMRVHKNSISRILHNGEWLSKPGEIKGTFYNHFSSFFNPQKQRRMLCLGDLVKQKLSHEDMEWLDRSFTLKEVEWALGQMPNEKAPGPDGFNVGCIKNFWPNIKDRVLEFFQNLYAGKPFPK